jgi:hypothetical protein
MSKVKKNPPKETSNKHFSKEAHIRIMAGNNQLPEQFFSISSIIPIPIYR